MRISYIWRHSIKDEDMMKAARAKHGEIVNLNGVYVKVFVAKVTGEMSYSKYGRYNKGFHIDDDGRIIYYLMRTGKDTKIVDPYK